MVVQIVVLSVFVVGTLGRIAWEARHGRALPTQDNPALEIEWSKSIK